MRIDYIGCFISDFLFFIFIIWVCYLFCVLVCVVFSFGLNCIFNIRMRRICYYEVFMNCSFIEWDGFFDYIICLVVEVCFFIFGIMELVVCFYCCFDVFVYVDFR